MNPVEILEAKLAELVREQLKADQEHEYARNTYLAAGDKLEKLERSVKTLQRAIEVLKSQ